MNPHDRIVAGLAAQPEGPRRRRFDPPLQPNPQFDRLLLQPELAASVMSPTLRMSLGLYRRQLAAAYAPNPEYDQLLDNPALYAQMDTAPSRPQLDHYRAAKQAYEAEQEYTQ
ncbi:MAG: hypothetical protein M3Q08_16610 [Pseudomonadota bacterium]|nr:hypothetical protein [Pseudomonadota bacterium]